MKPFARTAAVVGSGLLLLVALAQPAWAQVPQQGCGQEGENPCPVSSQDNGLICDTGLIPHVYVFDGAHCGCAKTIFGFCLGNTCTKCVNYTRRLTVVEQMFMGGWTDWALRNQRELAQDEPLNWVMQIATHNSYNTYADGHALLDFPNQVFSTTDQLRAGARVITFDNYWISPASPAARLCHSLSPETAIGFCFGQIANPLYTFPLYPPDAGNVHPSLRYYSNGIAEIRSWLDNNPNEIVIIDFEEYVPGLNGPDGSILDPIRLYLGDMVLTPPPIPPATVTGSITNGVLTVSAVTSGTLHVDEGLTDAGGLIPPGEFIQSFGTGTGGTGTYNLSNGALPNAFLTVHTSLTVPSDHHDITITTTYFSGVFPDRWPTRREMLAQGKRVIIVDNAYPAGVSVHKEPAEQFEFAKHQLPSEILFSERGTVAGSYPDGTWFAVNQRRFPNCFNDPKHPSDYDQDFNWALFHKASIVVEERELGEFVGASLGVVPSAEFGLMSDADIASAAECNYSIITLDKYSQLLVPPDGSGNGSSLDYLLYTLIPDFHRQALAVWSWKSGDRGQNGDCAMLEGSSGRWISANCSSPANQARFACAMPRSESGEDPLKWQDPVGNDWRVTKAKGLWDAGPSACQAEFGSDGFVFSAPRNGYQNQKMQLAAAPALTVNVDNIWLNYRQNGDDKWVTGGGGSSTAPVAKAAGPQAAECGTSVKLDASGSYSRDGGTLAYRWQGPFGILTTPIVILNTPRDLPLGVDPIGLTVTDSLGGTATDSLTVTVKDTTPPSLTVSLSTGSAPRHSRFVPVSATIAAKDSCDSEPPTVKLVSIALVPEKDRDKDHDKDHEKDHGDHEKDHDKDHDRNEVVTYYRDAQFGTDDQTFELARGEEHDRRYMVTYSATDLSGNLTQSSAKVVVEEAHEDHDRREGGH